MNMVRYSGRSGKSNPGRGNKPKGFEVEISSVYSRNGRRPATRLNMGGQGGESSQRGHKGSDHRVSQSHGKKFEFCSRCDEKVIRAV